MTTLATDFSDGDVFYSGTTSDTDKLNGITNEVNQKLVPLQIYSGTDLNFDVDNDGSTQTNSLELDTITSPKDYVKLNINGLATGESGNNVSGSGRVYIQIEHKEVGGAYSDAVPERTILYARGDDSDFGYAHINFEYYYEPTSGEKSNGLILKVTIKGVNSGTSSGVSWNTTQITTLNI